MAVVVWSRDCDLCNPTVEYMHLHVHRMTHHGMIDGDVEIHAWKRELVILPWITCVGSVKAALLLLCARSSRPHGESRVLRSCGSP
jgi:hypothetical protein